MILRTLLSPIIKIFDFFERFVSLSPFGIFIIPLELKDYKIIDAFQLSFTNKSIENKGRIMNRDEAIQADNGIVSNDSSFLGNSKAILLTLFEMQNKRAFVQFEISDDGTNDVLGFYKTWIDYLDGQGIISANFNQLKPASAKKHRISFFLTNQFSPLFKYRLIGFYRNLNDWNFYNVKVFIIE